MLSPYLPLAMLAASMVALLRGLITDAKGKSRLDGKAVVLPIVAVVAVAVCAWSQLRTEFPSVLDWRKVGADAPVVFILAAGGATFLQRLKDRGVMALIGEIDEARYIDPVAAAQFQSDLAAQKAALEKMSTGLVDGTIKVVGKVEVANKPTDPDAAAPVG